mmetsp:Transcript_40934/g.80091  ORF Transcript_40934/g.80091 Transcript_40934/m.80091 type:complete len:208 (-) Transcript_40934:674-1297(-)
MSHNLLLTGWIPTILSLRIPTSKQENNSTTLTIRATTTNTAHPSDRRFNLPPVSSSIHNSSEINRPPSNRSDSRCSPFLHHPPVASNIHNSSRETPRSSRHRTDTRCNLSLTSNRRNSSRRRIPTSIRRLLRLALRTSPASTSRHNNSWEEVRNLNTNLSKKRHRRRLLFITLRNIFMTMGLSLVIAPTLIPPETTAQIGTNKAAIV